MMRIRKQDLENALVILNSISRRRYTIYRAYGKNQLCYYVNQKSSAITNITGFCTKRELYEVIWAIIHYAQIETEMKVTRAIQVLINHFHEKPEIVTFLRKLVLLR